MMHGLEKSDSAVVAAKPANKADVVSTTAMAEWVKPRAETKGNADQPHTRWTTSRTTPCRPMPKLLGHTGITSSTSGDARSGDAARRTGRPGREWIAWPPSGCRHPTCFIHGRKIA
jgi:hypothetical protein